MMTMEKTLIQYQGFHPTDFTQEYLNSVIEEIKTEAPYGATVKAIFSRKEGIIKAFVEVHSPVGPFYAIASSRHVKETGVKILEQMRKRLSKWKGKRYQRQKTRELKHQFFISSESRSAVI